MKAFSNSSQKFSLGCKVPVLATKLLSLNPGHVHYHGCFTQAASEIAHKFWKGLSEAQSLGLTHQYTFKTKKWNYIMKSHGEVCGWKIILQTLGPSCHMVTSFWFEHFFCPSQASTNFREMHTLICCITPDCYGSCQRQ